MSDVRMDDDETAEEDEVVDSPVVPAVAEAPAEVLTEEPEAKVDETVVDKVEPAPETPEPVPSFADTLLKEIAESDPMKAALIEKAIAKEATRQKDEWAGREAGWIEKADRKAYAKDPKKWVEDKRKLVEYDQLRAEVEKLRSVPKPETPAKVVETPVVESVLDKAKKFVTKNNIDEAQTPLIAALFEEIKAEAGPAKGMDPVAMRQELAKIQWEKETKEAESDSDYKSNRALRALAWANAHEGMSPKEALLSAKAELGIKPKVVTRVGGSPVQGRPAFAKPSGTVKPADGLVYDGKTDPFKALRKKYSTEE